MAGPAARAARLPCPASKTSRAGVAPRGDPDFSSVNAPVATDGSGSSRTWHHNCSLSEQHLSDLRTEAAVFNRTNDGWNGSRGLGRWLRALGIGAALAATLPG